MEDTADMAATVATAEVDMEDVSRKLLLISLLIFMQNATHKHYAN